MNAQSAEPPGGRSRAAPAWTTSICLRTSDLDYLGHVTAAAYVVFFEESRVRWLSEAWQDRNPAYVVARQQIEYRRELRLHDRKVAIAIGIVRIGRSSFDVVEELGVDGGESNARSEATLVAWDPKRRAPRPLSDAERHSLAAHLPAVDRS